MRHSIVRLPEISEEPTALSLWIATCTNRRVLWITGTGLWTTYSRLAGHQGNKGCGHANSLWTTASEKYL